MAPRERNFDDSTLESIADELDEGEQTLLVTAGALPMWVKDDNPDITSKDVARMIELVRE